MRTRLEFGPVGRVDADILEGHAGHCEREPDELAASFHVEVRELVGGGHLYERMELLNRKLGHSFRNVAYATCDCAQEMDSTYRKKAAVTARTFADASATRV